MKEIAAEKFLSTITDKLPIVPCNFDKSKNILKKTEQLLSGDLSGNPEKKLKLKTMIEFMKEGAFEPPQVYRKSFIQSRIGKDGTASGPEALFGEFLFFYFFIFFASCNFF